MLAGLAPLRASAGSAGSRGPVLSVAGLRPVGLNPSLDLLGVGGHPTVREQVLRAYRD